LFRRAREANHWGQKAPGFFCLVGLRSWPPRLAVYGWQFDPASELRSVRYGPTRAHRLGPGSLTHSAHASGTARLISKLFPTWKRQLNIANLRGCATVWPIKPELNAVNAIKVFSTKWRLLGQSSQTRLRMKTNASRLRLSQPLLVGSPPATTRLAPYASALP
jgi:hypothetical protein